MSNHKRVGKAWRRHDIERLKKTRSKYWDIQYKLSDENGLTKEQKIKCIGKYFNNPKPCSCIICGNPRHRWKVLTRAEQKSNESFKQMLKDL